MTDTMLAEMRPRIRRYLDRCLRHYGEDVIDDAESDVWIAWCRRREHIEDSMRWLPRVAQHTVFEYHRQQKVQRKRWGRMVSLQQHAFEDSPETIGDLIPDPYGEPTFIVGRRRIDNVDALSQHQRDMDALMARLKARAEA